MKINYVIATYSGYIRDRDEKEEYVLQVNLENIYSFLKKQPSLISQVTVVCPEPRGKVYENYYQKELWEKKFSEISTKLVYIPYVGENKHHSYDQWLQGYTNFPNFDYYLFLEDDYAVSTEIPDFDQKLIDVYKKKFPDNIGYLCSKAGANLHEYHAMVSNGLISRETFEKFDRNTIIQTLYNTETGFYKCPQLKFSFMFLQRNIPIEDYTEYFSTPFWNSVKKEITVFGNEKLPAIIFPVQKNLYNL